MTDHIDPIRLIDDSLTRRLWLLVEAARSVPFDRALELARIAEAFITGSVVENTADQPSATVLGQGQESAEQFDDHVSNGRAAHRRAERSGFTLVADERDRLLERLAQGARNAELAAEFGLSAKQVRMGCAREVVQRRAKLADKPHDPAERHHDGTATVPIEKIVQYLRQQDDVVVPQEHGWYLVNGRFRKSPPSSSPVRTACEPGSVRQRSKHPPHIWTWPPVLRRRAIRCSGRNLQRPSRVPTTFSSRRTSTLKARSSLVERCQHMAEVGGSIPSRAYTLSLSRCRWGAWDNNRCRTRRQGIIRGMIDGEQGATSADQLRQAATTSDSDYSLWAPECRREEPWNTRFIPLLDRRHPWLSYRA
jgi:hypothetical protein